MLTGGCLCGRVRYEVRADPIFEAACHCRNCQKQTGASFSVVIGVQASALELTGALSVFADVGDSGGAVNRYFCGACGSPIYSQATANPAVLYLKAGTLDDPMTLAPKMHVWVESAWPSTLFPAEAIKIARNPG